MPYFSTRHARTALAQSVLPVVLQISRSHGSWYASQRPEFGPAGAGQVFCDAEQDPPDPPGPGCAPAGVASAMSEPARRTASAEPALGMSDVGLSMKCSLSWEAVR